jgi:tetratricopeptide (TPR) repeat protein
MLETLRQYAREKLDAAGDADSWRRRHAEHFTTFAEEAGPALLGPNELEWRPRVGHELDNLRAAVFWGLDHGEPADVEDALRIITALAYEGTMRRTAGVATWAERALEHIDDDTPSGSRMAIRGTAALASVHRSEWDRANDLAEQALEAGVAPDCPSPNIAIVARCMGRMYAGDRQGAIEMARSYIEELDRLQVSSFDRANIRTTTAIWLLVAGDVQDAALLADESLRMARSIGNPSAIAMATETLAWSLERSEPARALELHDEAIALIRSGASDVMLTNALMRSARLCASAGRRLEALRRLREAVLHSFDDADQPSTGGALDIGIVMLVSLGCDTTACTIAGGVLGRPRPLLMTPADDAVERDSALEAVLSRLGNVSFEQAWSAGARMTYEDLVQYAVRELEQLIAETRP